MPAPTHDPRRCNVMKQGEGWEGEHFVPFSAPLLFSDGSLQRFRQPSPQQSVPVTHLVSLVQVLFRPMKQRRFVGGFGQESAKNQREASEEKIEYIC